MMRKELVELVRFDRTTSSYLRAGLSFSQEIECIASDVKLSICNSTPLLLFTPLDEWVISWGIVATTHIRSRIHHSYECQSSSTTREPLMKKKQTWLPHDIVIGSTTSREKVKEEGGKVASKILLIYGNHADPPCVFIEHSDTSMPSETKCVDNRFKHQAT